MNMEWQSARVIDIIDETPDTKRYIVEMPNVTCFDFKPGQFVTLDLPIHEKKNKRWRSYSIASEPDGTNRFELLIELIEGGLGTNYLWNQIQIGDSIMLRGPAGVFVLPEPIEHDYFMICTGTGIAPFRSMVRYIYNQSVPCKNIYLIFGARTKSDLLYFDEMNTLAERAPNFHYFPTLSRETWEGRTGHVHAIYKELVLEKQTANFLICGWKEMVDEAKHNLLGMGYDKKQIHYELYG